MNNKYIFLTKWTPQNTLWLLQCSLLKTEKRKLKHLNLNQKLHLLKLIKFITKIKFSFYLLMKNNAAKCNWWDLLNKRRKNQLHQKNQLVDQLRKFWNHQLNQLLTQLKLTNVTAHAWKNIWRNKRKIQQKLPQRVLQEQKVHLLKLPKLLRVHLFPLKKQLLLPKKQPKLLKKLLATLKKLLLHQRKPPKKLKKPNLLMRDF